MYVCVCVCVCERERVSERERERERERRKGRGREVKEVTIREGNGRKAAVYVPLGSPRPTMMFCILSGRSITRRISSKSVQKDSTSWLYVRSVEG